MILEVLTEDGRTRKVRRTVVMLCPKCEATFNCPISEDSWVWLKSSGAEAFKASHPKAYPVMDFEEA